MKLTSCMSASCRSGDLGMPGVTLEISVSLAFSLYGPRLVPSTLDGLLDSPSFPLLETRPQSPRGRWGQGNYLSTTLEIRIYIPIDGARPKATAGKTTSDWSGEVMSSCALVEGPADGGSCIENTM